MFGPILISGQKVKVGAQDVAETQQKTFTCFVLGERLCPRESESSEFVSCCVLGASVISCTEVSKASTSILRPGFRIDFW